MNILVDTNIWLDVLQDRRPHYEDSARVLTVLDSPAHSAFLCATTLTTIFYLVARKSRTQVAFEQVGLLLKHYQVAAVDGAILQSALSCGFSDYEDAVLEQSALRAGLDAIVTRNPTDFSKSRLIIYTPAELLAALLESRSC